MYYSGYRRASAVADIGHRSSYGSGDGNAAKEWHHDIGRTLTDKLGIGVGMATVRPSATVADSSDSMAASTAMVKAQA